VKVVAEGRAGSRSVADQFPITAPKASMNDAIAAIALGRRIDLTRQPDFSIAGVLVRPTACEVTAGGRRIRLQPRVMQVLVALARAADQPVSRETLIEVCWGPVMVSEDALNRCIQRLRRLAETEARGAFTIETIPKIGYRLTANPQAAAETEAAGPAPDRRRYRLMVAGGLACVALLAISGVWIWRARPTQWSITSSERLISSPLFSVGPAFSVDGATLAYAASPDSINWRIYLKRLSGGEPIALTDDGYADLSPAWSPDGAQIAYVAYRAGEPCRIKVTPVPAGLAREVGRCRGEEFSRIAWSPSGDALLFVDAAKPAAPTQIVSLDLATGRRQAITHSAGGRDDVEPSVSPDGRWLLFSTSGSQRPGHLTIQDLKTGRERIVAVVPRGVAGGVWSSDSKTVFFEDDDAQEYTIRASPITGGPSRLVLGLPSAIGRLASGKGNLLAAEISTGRLDPANPPAVKGGGPVIIDPANASTADPVYSSDGTLALASNRSGDGAIWLMPPGGRSRMLLATQGGAAFPLAWSPDGAKLAYIAINQTIALHIVGAGGEEMATVPAPGVEVGRAVWTGDGRALVFPVRDARGWRLWRSDLARPASPYPMTGYGWTAVRTAGEAMYGVKAGQPGVWRLGPTPKLITDRFSGRYREAWQVYRNQIIFADDSDPKHPVLLSTSVSGGPTRTFAQTPQAVIDAGFDIDPRSGTPVYIAALGFETDIDLFHLVRK
jgi:Tol biopolymer transport system component/DNA-binding winged helix-turn-helix (wHTH) protein